MSSFGLTPMPSKLNVAPNPSSPGAEASQPSLAAVRDLNAGTERLIQLATINQIKNGHSLEDTTTWIWHAFKDGGVAGLVEKAMPKMPNLVNEEAFVQAGMGAQSAQAAWKSYQALRAQATGYEGLNQMSSTAAWNRVLKVYLYGIYNGGNAGAAKALSNLAASVTPQDLKSRAPAPVDGPPIPSTPARAPQLAGVPPSPSSARPRTQPAAETTPSLNPGVERVYGKALKNQLRQGLDRPEAESKLQQGQKDGGLAKLVELATPPAPKLVNQDAFLVGGMGKEAAKAAWLDYRLLRGEAAGMAGLAPVMSSDEAWRFVFKNYLYGIHNGGDAGGLNALNQLKRMDLPNARLNPGAGVPEVTDPNGKPLAPDPRASGDMTGFFVGRTFGAAEKIPFLPKALNTSLPKLVVYFPESNTVFVAAHSSLGISGAKNPYPVYTFKLDKPLETAQVGYGGSGSIPGVAGSSYFYNLRINPQEYEKILLLAKGNPDQVIPFGTANLGILVGSACPPETKRPALPFGASDSLRAGVGFQVQMGMLGDELVVRSPNGWVPINLLATGMGIIRAGQALSQAECPSGDRAPKWVPSNEQVRKFLNDGGNMIVGGATAAAGFLQWLGSQMVSQQQP